MRRIKIVNIRVNITKECARLTAGVSLTQMHIRDAVFGWRIEKGCKTARRTGPFGRTWFRMVVYFRLNWNLNRSAKNCFEDKIRICSHQGCAGFHLQVTSKTYLVARLGDLLFEIIFEIKTVTIICLFVFDFLCCIEVCKVKWLNSRMFKFICEVKTSVMQRLCPMRTLKLAFSDAGCSFRVYFV